MPVWNGVNWREKNTMPGSSPTLSLDPEGESRAEMMIWVPWGSLVTQIAGAAFLGTSSVVAGPPKYLTRTNPFSHPDHPASFYLAKSFSKVTGDKPLDPAISARGTAQFDEAAIALAFRASQNGYRVLEDAVVIDPAPADLGAPRAAEYFLCRCCEIVERQKTRYQTVPHNAGLKWVGSGPPLRNVAVAAFIILFESEITISWYPVSPAGYNEAAALALVGKTNDKPFPPPAPGGCPPSFMATRPAGTLLWGTPEKKVIWQGDETPALRIDFHMSYSPFKVNAFFWWDRPAALGGPGYNLVQTADGGALFAPGNFTQPFIPP